MIKGHAKIELTNVKTGEVKVVEDDNIVTKAPEIYESMSRLGGGAEDNNVSNFANDIIFYDKIKKSCICDIPLVDAYFGGILLLKDTVDEDAYPPVESDTNEMVGNGSVKDSFTETKEYGSYNEQESLYEVKDGMITRKYVYDFGTSKANGTISSICLCNYQYGFSGCGNSDKSFVLENKASYRADYMRASTSSSISSSSRRGLFSLLDLSYNGEKIISDESDNKNKYDRVPFYVDFESNKEYLIPRLKKNAFIDKDMTSIKIYENNFSRNNVNLMLKDNECIRMLEVEFPEELKTMVNQLGTRYINWNNAAFNYYNNKLTIVFAKNIYYIDNTASDDYIYVWNINLNLKAMTSSGSEFKKIKNTSGLKYSAIYYGDSFVIYKKWLYVISSSNASYDSYKLDMKIHKINLENYADIVEINIDIMKEVLTKWSNSNPFFISLFATASNVYISAANSTSSVGHDDDRMSFVIKNDKVKVLNKYIAASDISKYYKGLKANIFSNNVLLINSCTQSYANENSIFSILFNVQAGYNPFLLSTINNLSEPVTKTADMTMKITYTLTGSVVDTNSEGS